MVAAGPETDPRRRGSRRSQGSPQGRKATTPAAQSRGAAGKHSLGMLEAAMQHVAEGVVIVDLEGHFLFANEAAHKIVGMDPVDSAPSEWPALYGCFRADKVTPYPAEELPLVRAMRGEHVREEEIFIRNPENPKGVWISVNSSPLEDEQGRVIGGAIVFRDVTAHRRSREVVRRLSKTIERTTDAVFITDADGVIEYVNPAFETITGYPGDEAIGRKPNIIKSGLMLPAYYDALWETIRKGEVHSGTLVNRRKDGALFHAEQTITPIREVAGQVTHFVSVMRDVTELKRGQEREVEIRLARRVQQKLYPTRAPRVDGFDLAGATFPADQTCGDYYDFIPMADGRVAIAVGDVSGHGFSAALLMAETRAYLRSLVRTSAELDQILRQLNVFLCEDTEDERFVTLMLTILDPQRGCLVFSSAGHIPGYVLDHAGAIRRQLESTGMPLGIFGDADFPVSPEIPLTEGDLVLLLTDGATEARNADGDFFEADGVLRVVAEERGRGAHEVIRGLQAAIERFGPGAPQDDDITAVVCKVRESP